MSKEAIKKVIDRVNEQYHTAGSPVLGLKKGYFITFEGSDGAGKSTQIDLLRQGLESSGFKVRQLREPGGTLIGEKIRAILKDPNLGNMKPETELLLLNASRAQLVREVIRPALEAGEIVVCDRYYHSTLLYQVFGRELDPAYTHATIQFAIEDTVPDLTFLLFLDPEKAKERTGKRDIALGQDRFEAGSSKFYDNIQRGIEWLKSREANSLGKLVAINADDTLENLANEIYRCSAFGISKLREGQLDVTKPIVKPQDLLTGATLTKKGSIV